MPITLTDEQIAKLIGERKMLPGNFLQKAQPKEKRGHKESEITVRGLDGSEFVLIFRRSSLSQLDFSAILAVKLPRVDRVFRLRRYNGKSHEHTNRIEGDRFFDFHIHQATERYQARGLDEEAFAEPTNRYTEYNEAVQCLVDDCSCEFREIQKT